MKKVIKLTEVDLERMVKKIIKESHNEKIIKYLTNWMNKKFSPDQLEIVTSKKYPGSIFFKKDGFVVMEQDKKYQDFYFDYDEIWSFFESVFGMEYQQIEEVLSYWLEETLKLKDYKPFTNLSSGVDERWWKLSN